MVQLSTTMNLESLVSAWPNIDGNIAASSLKQVDRSTYPELDRYSQEEIYRDIQGEGGLFLASDMARELQLRPRMNVLDLACGTGETSVFLARNYGVNAFAVDKLLDESRLSNRATSEGVGHLVTPKKLDARDLNFPDGFFDAVFCMNAYFYFGTDDLYLPYLLGRVRDAGRICIASPCYREEISPVTPEEFLMEFPDCLAVHSPTWWRSHFEKTRGVDILRCELHSRSREFWEDFVRIQIEMSEPRMMSPSKATSILGFLKFLKLDTRGYVSHLFLLAAKKAGVRFGASLDWYSG